MNPPTDETTPGLLKWGLGVAASAGLTGMLCCVAPMVLFMLGLMGGSYAISFADFFYNDDGSAGTGAWVLRGTAAAVGAAGLWRYNGQQHQCSIDPEDQKKNLILLSIVITTLGTGFFLSFEAISSWYFDAYIVPAQQLEMGIQ